MSGVRRWRTTGAWLGAHRDVEHGGGDDGAVATEPGVGDGGAEERQHGRGARPRVHRRGRRRRGLAERAGQVADEVGRDAVVGEPLGHLHPCTHLPPVSESDQGRGRASAGEIVRGSGLQIMKRADFQPPVDGARRPGRSGSEEAGLESDAMAGWRLTLVCSRSASERRQPLLTASLAAWRVWTLDELRGRRAVGCSVRNPRNHSNFP